MVEARKRKQAEDQMKQQHEEQKKKIQKLKEQVNVEKKNKDWDCKSLADRYRG